MRRPIFIFLAGAALLVVVVLRGALNPGTGRLPGVDAGNLYAWEVYTRSVLADRHLPFWNPYHFSGTPHLADPQTTVFYPPALLLRWLPVPAFLAWMIALHLVIAGAGTLFVGRVLGLRWTIAYGAAAAVMLGGSVPGGLHNGHLLPIYSLAWVPWALGLAIVSVRSGRMVPDGRLVAVLVLHVLSGYVQGSLYLAAMLCSYYLYSVFWPPEVATPMRRWVPLTQLGALAALSALAAAFMLLPTSALISESGRHAGVSYQEALKGSWHVRDLATLLFPFYGVTGSPPHRFLSDHLAYVGWILTAFTPFAFFRRDRLRISIFLGLMAVGACALALGEAGGLFDLQYALSPGLRIPGRVLFLATVSLSLLGGIGLEACLALAAERRWRIAWPLAISAGGIAWATAVVVSSAQTTPTAPGWPWMSMALGVAILVVVSAALARSHRVAIAVALGATLVDMTSLTTPALSTIPIEADATIRHWIGPPSGGRALSLCEHRIGAREFLQNREPTLDGVPGLNSRDYGDWAVLVKSGDGSAPSGLYHRVGSDGASPVRPDMLDMANVTRIVRCAPGSIGEVAVERNDRAWPRAVWSCGAADVSRREAIARIIRGRYEAPGTLRDVEVKDAPSVAHATGTLPATVAQHGSMPPNPDEGADRTLLPAAWPCADRATVDVTLMDRPDGHVSARVTAPRDGVLFFSEPFYSERRAFVDGRRVPALKANLAFTAVMVPAGQHEVQLQYVPSRFYLGSTISALTIACYAAACLRRSRKKRHIESGQEFVVQ